MIVRLISGRRWALAAAAVAAVLLLSQSGRSAQGASPVRPLPVL